MRTATIATLCLLGVALLAMPLPVAAADPVEIRGNCVWLLPDGPEKVGPVYTGGIGDWPLVCIV